MVKLNRIYTRTGDDGTTGLATGERRQKDDGRVAAYGSTDEAMSCIGVARLHASPEQDAVLARIQNDLFDVGADLATPGDDFLAHGTKPEWKPLRVAQAQIDRLEAEIDAMNEALEPLNSFILPGGTPLAAHLHVARTVVRRAEREAVAAARAETINPLAVRYLNRLSDHLFVMARHANGGNDPLWVPGKNR